MNRFWQRIVNTIKEVLPSTLKTAWWLIKITVSVSFCILLLRYIGVIDLFSQWLGPAFAYLGLPGEAALVFVTGYFVNVYSAIAAATSLELSRRAITILAVMVLCAHNMITETAVQKKTGSSVIRILSMRTLSAVILGMTLNLLLPEANPVNPTGGISELTETGASFVSLLLPWLRSTSIVVLKMTTLVFSLSILQALLTEFGVIRWLSRGLRPLMTFLGLPANTAFLWIVANTLGLAYGVAVMVDECQKGNVSHTDADLLNHHICIAHSNLEDVLLFVSVGAMIGWLLISRWAMAFVLVWERRLEYSINNRRKVRMQKAATKP